MGTGGLISDSLSIDIYGNETHNTATINRTNKLETRTTDYPDSTIDEVSITENGLLISTTSKSGVVLTYSYDDLGRNTGVTDPRIGTSVTHYNDKGQVDWVEDAAENRTLFTYDPDTGQKIAEENALNKFTRYAYDDLGQLTRAWGETAYPVEYVYDSYGRMEEMHTFSEKQWGQTFIIDRLKRPC
ncbi:MAG: RHS repeat protein [Desulfobacteraceae bacterium]|jgi:YD repeat-containing protein